MVEISITNNFVSFDMELYQAYRLIASGLRIDLLADWYVLLGTSSII